ncbi:hypothetical protein EDB89DRAFT_1980200, partial [Lactarius sanguifluus]
MMVKVLSDLFGWMKNVLLVVRLTLRVWSCVDETTRTAIAPCNSSVESVLAYFCMPRGSGSSPPSPSGSVHGA